ncbi:MAG: hypothetical protein WCF23_15380 [Candidatus Nitrosopolaris sp.]
MRPKDDIDMHESILRCNGSMVGAKCRDIVPSLGDRAQPVPNCPEGLFTERYGLAQNSTVREGSRRASPGRVRTLDLNNTNNKKNEP